MTSRTVSVFRNGRNQAIRLPKEFEYPGIDTLEAFKEGDVVMLRPARPSWVSLKEQVEPIPDFLLERRNIFEPDRFELED
jgi:antitoxin VapB